MPHFGLMDADALGPERAALERARLHIRGGKRRLRQGKISYGIITLYDALAHAMMWHFESPELAKGLPPFRKKPPPDEKEMYEVLTRAGVLDGSFDLEAFDRLVEKALGKELSGFDYSGTLREIEKVMTQLGVMPFDESTLPPEDPSTY